MAEETRTVDLATLDFPTDPSKLPTIKEVPLGKLEFEIKGFSAELTKPTDPDSSDYAKGKRGEKLTIVAQLTVAQPEDFRGMPHTHRFYVGSDTDPNAKKESTWKANGTFLMKMFRESAVSLNANTKPQEAMLAAVGQHVIGEVKLEKSRDPKYQDKHVIRQWYKVGSVPVSAISDDGGAVLTAQPAAANPVFENRD